MWRSLALAAVCAGCVFPGSVEATGSGVSSGRQSQTIHCGGSATVERYLAGSGGVHISIFDGAFAPAFDDTAGVTGEVNDSEDLDGAPGMWRLTVDPEGFAGQFKVALSCL